MARVRIPITSLVGKTIKRITRNTNGDLLFEDDGGVIFLLVRAEEAFDVDGFLFDTSGLD